MKTLAISVKERQNVGKTNTRAYTLNITKLDAVAFK